MLSSLLWCLLPLGLLVSLLKYRLYDADAAISRSASYSFLMVLLLGGFSAAKHGADLLADSYFDGTAAGTLSSGIAAAFAALLIAPLHKRVVRWTQNRFQRGLLRLRRVPELVGDLRETSGLRLLPSSWMSRSPSMRWTAWPVSPAKKSRFRSVST